MKKDVPAQLKFLVDQSSLQKDIQERLFKAIEKLSSQEQIFLLQLFQKYPEKISAFWDVSKKKFEYIKNGVGDIEKILEEEIRVFSR